jgi:hypothetical protein
MNQSRREVALIFTYQNLSARFRSLRKELLKVLLQCHVGKRSGEFDLATEWPRLHMQLYLFLRGFVHSTIFHQ